MARTGKIKVPVWMFELQPLTIDEWWFNYWYAAPRRVWTDKSDDDKIKGYGLSFRAWRMGGQWCVDVDDILAT